MTAIQDLLNDFRTLSRSEQEKGRQFERLIANVLRADPQYADRLSNVWLWDEWPDH